MRNATGYRIPRRPGAKPASHELAAAQRSTAFLFRYDFLAISVQDGTLKNLPGLPDDSDSRRHSAMKPQTRGASVFHAGRSERPRRTMAKKGFSFNDLFTYSLTLCYAFKNGRYCKKEARIPNHSCSFCIDLRFQTRALRAHGFERYQR